MLQNKITKQTPPTPCYLTQASVGVLYQNTITGDVALKVTQTHCILFYASGRGFALDYGQNGLEVWVPYDGELILSNPK